MRISDWSSDVYSSDLPVLNGLIDSADERRALEEIEAYSSRRLTAERRGTETIMAGEFLRGVPQASFVNAAFAYFRPREANRFNGPGRGAWYASLTGTATCIAEIAFHVERELARIDRFEARIEYAELFASFAGEFLDLRDPAAPPDCLHPDIGVGYPAGNALRSEEHTSELQSLMRTSYADFCLKKKNVRPHVCTQYTHQHVHCILILYKNQMYTEHEYTYRECR